MDINEKIITILKEADLYQNQGLLNEAESKYREILKLFHTQLDIENNAKIKKAIEKKIRDLNQERKRVEKKVMSPHMTKESQDLITQMFVAGGGEDSDAKFEGAKALIKFGQFERAIDELNLLIREDSIKTDVAKQIITCYILSTKVDEGIDQIEQWISSDILSPEQLEHVINHTHELFQSRGIEIELPDIPKKEKTSVPIENTDEEKESMFKKDTFFFEEDFEEFDVLSSVKKVDKTGNKKKT